MSKPFVPYLQREAKNPAEQQCKKLLEEKGYKVMKRGYPDFIFFKGNNFYCVEVKPDELSTLSAYQIRVMDFLTSKGIVCYKYSPDVGFKRWDEKLSAQEKRRRSRSKAGKRDLKLLYENDNVVAKKSPNSMGK